MKLLIIAALDRNRVIGKGGKLPWHLPDDLKRFKRLTTGHTVLMGRKTFDSLEKRLPNRRNVVVSSRPMEGVESDGYLSEALQALEGVEVVFIIGGGEIFRQSLPIVDGLYLTVVDGEHDGDTFFPEYERLIGTTFKLTAKEDHEGYSFVDYIRISRSPQ
ncbi:MAG: dihydrofolate reductase [Proteobacteria bacterium]|nr:dihydrofolate reductase [Pseudomonadota bacterium]